MKPKQTGCEKLLGLIFDFDMRQMMNGEKRRTASKNYKLLLPDFLYNGFWDIDS
jgi:hypothetical protein